MQMLFQLEHQSNIVNSLLNVRPPKASNISNEDLKVRQSERGSHAALNYTETGTAAISFFFPLKGKFFFFFPRIFSILLPNFVRALLQC